MLCPFCAHLKNKVIDSRMSKEGEVIRRRRHCLACGRRFTTYERVEEVPFMVVKKDKRRERFDPQKVMQGVLRACEKRPVPMAKIQAIIAAAEARVVDSPHGECTTREIGELLMEELRKLDRVAYVRFASVYLDFQHEGEFVKEIYELQQEN